jgi:hypothetical protein
MNDNIVVVQSLPSRLVVAGLQTGPDDHHQTGECN